MKIGLNKHQAYASFTRDRDQALERLHTLAQLRASDVLRGVLRTTQTIVKSDYAHLIDESRPYTLSHLEKQLDQFYGFAAGELTRIIAKLRKTSFTLAKSGETEAIARTIDQPLTNRVHAATVGLRQMSKPSVSGGSVYSRVKLYLDKLKRKVVSAAQTAALSRDDNGTPLTVDEFTARVAQVFPQARKVSRPRRILKTMEAERRPKEDISIDMIDDQAWNEMLDDYKEEFIPKWRGPGSIVGGSEETEDAWYAWELERDLTNEFVSAVRDGQMEAANEAGITDFVWIAVVDKVTDECCLWRDGLLTSEIEEKLNTEHADDECKGTNPPIHFNCRCSLAPALDSIPEKPAVDRASFDEWLNS